MYIRLIAKVQSDRISFSLQSGSIASLLLVVFILLYWICTELIHYWGNSALRRHMESLPIGRYSSVLIMADYNREMDVMQSDSHALASLLLFKSIAFVRKIVINKFDLMDICCCSSALVHWILQVAGSRMFVLSQYSFMVSTQVIHWPFTLSTSTLWQTRERAHAHALHWKKNHDVVVGKGIDPTIICATCFGLKILSVFHLLSE